MDEVVSSRVPALQLRDLHVIFPRNSATVTAVDGLSFRLLAGRTLAIIGESGSGKTATSRAIMGLLPDTATVGGSVLLNGQELLGLSEREMCRRRGAGLAMIFQDPARALNPTMRVGRQITEAILQHEAIGADGARHRAIELLELLRVSAPEQRLSAYPHELSGGLRQRVMIAIAIAGKPQVLIADEATRSLDAATELDTLALLKDLQRQLGMALILISHDLRLASRVADEVLVMYAGRAVEHAPAQRLFSHARMRYTTALLNAIPRLDRPPHSLFPVIPGSPLLPAASGKSCPFEPRCTFALPVCRESRPPFEEQEDGHSWACWSPSMSGVRT